jgi:hypothetical protein
MIALKKYGVWIALVVAVLAAWGVSGFDDEAASDSGTRTNKSASNAHKTASAKTTGAAQHDSTAALALIARGFAPREAMHALRNDPFVVVSFEPPPPPAPPPSKPTAPPLSFKYLGALRDNDAPAVFLDSGGQLLIAHTGDTLAGQYRVLAITDTSIQFEYLPLSEQQTLNFGR